MQNKWLIAHKCFKFMRFVKMNDFPGFSCCISQCMAVSTLLYILRAKRVLHEIF